MMNYKTRHINSIIDLFHFSMHKSMYLPKLIYIFYIFISSIYIYFTT